MPTSKALAGIKRVHQSPRRRTKLEERDSRLKSGGAPPHSKTQARNVRPYRRPRFAVGSVLPLLDVLENCVRVLNQRRDRSRTWRTLVLLFVLTATVFS